MLKKAQRDHRLPMSPRLNEVVIPDEKIRVMPGMMLVEPMRPSDKIHLTQKIIIEMKPADLPGTIKARVIKFGKLNKPVDFAVGDFVEITPHAGFIIQSIKGVHERMTISVDEAIGVWDENESNEDQQ